MHGLANSEPDLRHEDGQTERECPSAKGHHGSHSWTARTTITSGYTAVACTTTDCMLYIANNRNTIL